MSNDCPKTIQQIKREHTDAWRRLHDQYNADIIEALKRDFPVGCRAKFLHGLKWIRGTVTKHGEYEFNADKVELKNDTTGKTWPIDADRLHSIDYPE